MTITTSALCCNIRIADVIVLLFFAFSQYWLILGSHSTGEPWNKFSSKIGAGWRYPINRHILHAMHCTTSPITELTNPYPAPPPLFCRDAETKNSSIPFLSSTSSKGIPWLVIGLLGNFLNCGFHILSKLIALLTFNRWKSITSPLMIRQVNNSHPISIPDDNTSAPMMTFLPTFVPVWLLPAEKNWHRQTYSPRPLHHHLKNSGGDKRKVTDDVHVRSHNRCANSRFCNSVQRINGQQINKMWPQVSFTDGERTAEGWWHLPVT